MLIEIKTRIRIGIVSSTHIAKPYERLTQIGAIIFLTLKFGHKYYEADSTNFCSSDGTSVYLQHLKSLRVTTILDMLPLDWCAVRYTV